MKAERNKAIIAAVAAGATYAEMGRRYNLTKQRVYRICVNANVRSTRFANAGVKRQEYSARLLAEYRKKQNRLDTLAALVPLIRSRLLSGRSLVKICKELDINRHEYKKIRGLVGVTSLYGRFSPRVETLRKEAPAAFLRYGTVYAAAKYLGCSAQLIRNALDKAGIKYRPGLRSLI